MVSRRTVLVVTVNLVAVMLSTISVANGLPVEQGKEKDESTLSSNLMQWQKEEPPNFVGGTYSNTS